MKNETTLMTATSTRLTGQALLDTIEALRAEGVTNKHIAIDCGYVYEEDNTKVAYTEFYTQMMLAKGYVKLDENGEVTHLTVEDTEDIEDEEVNDLTELKDKLIDEWGEAAVEAFLEWWDMEDLKHFEDAYIGCYWSGAKFAEEYACDGDVDRLPYYVAIDWEKTWDNIEGDYVVEDGYYFHRNW
jgi:hypothetical protein